MTDFLLNKCKMYIRKFKADALDEEVQDLIDAAKLDLKTTGIVCEDYNDPLMVQAITCYVKANYGYENKEAERFLASYESIKAKLSLCSEYNTVQEQEEGE